MEKFEILERYGFQIRMDQVVDTVSNPDALDHSRSPLLIAQKKLDDNHILRVVYKVLNKERVIITFYPGRTRQYGKKS